MATARALRHRVAPFFEISFPDAGKPHVSPPSADLVPGEGVVFQTGGDDCILFFYNEKVFGTHCAWLEKNTTTALYPVAASEHTHFKVIAVSEKVPKDGPGIGGGHI